MLFNSPAFRATLPCEFMGLLPVSFSRVFCSAQLLRNIDEARKAAFSGNTRSNGKELLLILIGPIAFYFTKNDAPGCAGGVSRLGDFGHVRSYVFTYQQLQSAPLNSAFVIAMRNEEIKSS